MFTRSPANNRFNDRTRNAADEVTSTFGIETNEIFEQLPGVSKTIRERKNSINLIDRGTAARGV